jgi:AraC-like DNA-binding protein
MDRRLTMVATPDARVTRRRYADARLEHIAPAITRLEVRMPVPHPRYALTPVATLLTRDERMRVDAAGEGVFYTMHRDSVDQVVRDLRQRSVGAVLVSVNRCDGREAASLARVVREFPRVSTVAILSQIDGATPRAVLSLGSSGVRTLIDVRQPAGWRELRTVIMSERTSEIEQLALSRLALDLTGATDGCVRFFELLFGRPVRVSTVRRLAAHLGVITSTLMSRFFRLRLPAPKKYLAYARLVHAARLFENPGLSIANVANHLDYSSPQSFGRHVRSMLGITATAFRQQYDGEGMLDHFRARLVIPYLTTLRLFDPVSGSATPAVRRVLADATERATPRVVPNLRLGRPSEPDESSGSRRAVAEGAR